LEGFIKNPLASNGVATSAFAVPESVRVHQEPDGTARIKINRRRWEFLDAIRGLAAILVVIQHGMERWSDPYYRFSHKYLGLGEAAVAAFFLVSGFVIPISLERYGSLKKFWAGRAFRLLPMYWTTLIAALLLNHFGLFALPAQSGVHWYRFLFANSIMMQDPLHQPAALGTFWTLTYETFFYCLCSLIFLLGVLKNTRILALAATLGYLLLTVAVAIALHASLSADKLSLVVTAFVGALIYRHSAGRATKAHLIQAIAIMAVALPVAQWIRLVRYPRPGDGNLNSFTSATVAWLAGYVLFLSFYAMRSREFPAVLLWLGRISYSVYLVHGILVGLIPQSVPVWIAMPVLLASTLLVSTLTYRFVEKPALSLQHRMFPHKPILVQVRESA
jgi:peptidoglycan/LPS O-acetylase OafA/YrhL